MKRIITVGVDFFLKRNKCPNCKSEKSEFYSQVFTPFFECATSILELSNDVKKNRLLLKCGDCGLIYHHIVPKKALLCSLFEGESMVERWKFGSSRNSIGKIDIIKKYSLGKTVLDVGCYSGELLSHFGENYELWGIEPLSLPAKLAKEKHSVNVIDGFLEEAKLPTDYFSVVTMFDIIEHIYDVKDGLAKIYNSLKTDGILVIETGNYLSLFARLLRGSWWYFSLLEHLAFWSENSLTRTLENLGFQVLLCRRTIHHRESVQGILYSYLLTSIFYIIAKSKFEEYFLKICKKLGKLGTLPSQYYPDHIFLIAKK